MVLYFLNGKFFFLGVKSYNISNIIVGSGGEI